MSELPATYRFAAVLRSMVMALEVAVPLSLFDAPTAGRLKRVQYHLFEDDLLMAIALTFEGGPLYLAAQADDDSLVVLDAVPETSPIDVSSRAPWKKALDRNCLWSWSLTNQAGHRDGAQLVFTKPPTDPDVCVQLMVIGSQIDVHLVGERLPGGPI